MYQQQSKLFIGGVDDDVDNHVCNDVLTNTSTTTTTTMAAAVDLLIIKDSNDYIETTSQFEERIGSQSEISREFHWLDFYTNDTTNLLSVDWRSSPNRGKNGDNSSDEKEKRRISFIESLNNNLHTQELAFDVINDEISELKNGNNEKEVRVNFEDVEHCSQNSSTMATVNTTNTERGDEMNYDEMDDDDADHFYNEFLWRNYIRNNFIECEDYNNNEINYYSEPIIRRRSSVSTVSSISVPPAPPSTPIHSDDEENNSYYHYDNHDNKIINIPYVGNGNDSHEQLINNDNEFEEKCDRFLMIKCGIIVTVWICFVTILLLIFLSIFDKSRHQHDNDYHLNNGQGDDGNHTLVY